MTSKIDEYRRSEIERQRLHRLIDAQSRAPTEEELELLDDLLDLLHPEWRDSGRRFVGMNAVSLSGGKKHYNLDKIDVEGYAALKADGLDALMCRVRMSSLPSNKTRVGRTQLAETISKPPPQVEHGKREDTVLLITRDDKVRAFDRVRLLTRQRVVLQGELCLRKKRLNPHELQLVESAYDVHSGNYIEYPSNKDTQDKSLEFLCSEEHQQVYDNEWELNYAAFDCLLVGGVALAENYTNRLELLRAITEVLVAQPNLTEHRIAMEQLAGAKWYAGGADNFTLPVFAKRPVMMRDIRAAFSAIPRQLRGVHIDGVVFTPDKQAYTCCKHNDTLLKWKPVHTVDFSLQRKGSKLGLYVQQRGKPVLVSTQICIDTRHAQDLLEYCISQNFEPIVECAPVIKRLACQQDSEQQQQQQQQQQPSHSSVLENEVWWSPMLVRKEKKSPNSKRNYDFIIDAVMGNLRADAIVDIIVDRVHKHTDLKRHEQQFGATNAMFR